MLSNSVNSLGLLQPAAESSSLSQLCCDGVGIEIRVRDGGGGRRFGVCRHHMVEVLEHGFDLKRCLGVRILEAKQTNSDDSAVGIETNILAKESEGLETGICRDAVGADVEGENEGRAVADKGKLESAEGCVGVVVSGAALALVRATLSGIGDELWDTELAHELDKRFAGNGSSRCE